MNNKLLMGFMVCMGMVGNSYAAPSAIMPNKKASASDTLTKSNSSGLPSGRMSSASFSDIKEGTLSSTAGSKASTNAIFEIKSLEDFQDWCSCKKTESECNNARIDGVTGYKLDNLSTSNVGKPESFVDACKSVSKNGIECIKIMQDSLTINIPMIPNALSIKDCRTFGFYDIHEGSRGCVISPNSSDPKRQDSSCHWDSGTNKCLTMDLACAESKCFRGKASSDKIRDEAACAAGKAKFGTIKSIATGGYKM